MPNKDEIARRLIRWHFEVEPGLNVVHRILSENEDDPAEPIKLLEINTATVATGSFEAYRFAPTRDVPYPTLIAEVTPDELEQLRAEGRIPESWNLERAQTHRRPAA
ncbi:MAG TPA: hypothetical protein ENJ18_01785 [Nannocystis exedens]|nr:hypothetical protein [Nannocystis exedens]